MLKCHRIIYSLESVQNKELDSVKYKDIFGNSHEQFQLIKVFQTLIGIRERLLKRDEEPAYMGKNTGPSGYCNIILILATWKYTFIYI